MFFVIFAVICLAEWLLSGVLWCVDFMSVGIKANGTFTASPILDVCASRKGWSMIRAASCRMDAVCSRSCHVGDQVDCVVCLCGELCGRWPQLSVVRFVM